MLQTAIYEAITMSTPTTKEGHGSRHPNKCNVYSCVVNGGKEKHKLELKEWHTVVNNRYKEITKEDVV